MIINSEFLYNSSNSNTLMTFALGVFDKFKDLTGKIDIKGVGNKLKNMVVQEQKVEEDMGFQIKNNKNQLKSNKLINKPLQELTEEQRMNIQLREFKKLKSLEEQILNEWRTKEKQQLTEKQKYLSNYQAQLIQKQNHQRKEAQRSQILNQIQSGQRTIGSLIEDNIRMKEKIILNSS